ncbi:uncharacterized protein LOC128204463 [Mya arenaria]|uniref:uncharacterized protein LOC128204463 n=1 Tax=Mya arenaria TaxID=6604 RepID=UPI0022E71624|nr:uncharacterized protein LOC128204463 [Mya arenaria]
MADDRIESTALCSTHPHAYLADVTQRTRLSRGSLSTERDAHVWLGATDEITEGEFVWNVSNQKVNYTDWGPGEPNSNALNIREDCLIYWAHYSWKWADLDCHQKCYFVCEMPYRKICQPQRWQFSTKSAKLFVTCAFIVSSIMSARVFIISDIVSVNISWNYGNMSYIVGKYCTSSVEDNQQHVVLISHLIDGVTFIVILATFLFMYGKILKVLRHHRSQTKVIRSARRNPGPSVYFKADNDEPNVTVLDLDTLSFEGNITQKIRSNVLKTSQSITIRWDRSIEISSNSSSPRLRRVRPNKPEDNLLAKHSNKDIGDFEQGSLYRKAISERRFDRKIAIMLLAVTVGFVVCFTPYFAATFTLRSESRDYDLELSPAIQVALRMPFMNSVINPIIFYACDTKFRYFAKYCCKK